MEKASLIVKEIKESRRKNFEITCYSDHFSLCFWSGSRRNEFVAQPDEDEIRVNVERVTWRERQKDVFNAFLDNLKNVFV